MKKLKLAFYFLKISCFPFYVNKNVSVLYYGDLFYMLNVFETLFILEVIKQCHSTVEWLWSFKGRNIDAF